MAVLWICQNPFLLFVTKIVNTIYSGFFILLFDPSEQETLIGFMKRKLCFESVSYEKAWLFRVDINISKNKIQYNKIRSIDELSEIIIAH